MISFIKFNVIIEILKYEKPMKLNHIKDRQVVNYFVIGDKGKFYDPTRVSKSHKSGRIFPHNRKKLKSPKERMLSVCTRDVIPWKKSHIEPSVAETLSRGLERSK